MPVSASKYPLHWAGRESGPTALDPKLCRGKDEMSSLLHPQNFTQAGARSGLVALTPG